MQLLERIQTNGLKNAVPQENIHELMKLWKGSRTKKIAERVLSKKRNFVNVIKNEEGPKQETIIKVQKKDSNL